MNKNDLINKEVCINGREGEIIEILGVDFVKIQFFNLNDGECTLSIKDVEKYLL